VIQDLDVNLRPIAQNSQISVDNNIYEGIRIEPAIVDGAGNYAAQIERSGPNVAARSHQKELWGVEHFEFVFAGLNECTESPTLHLSKPIFWCRRSAVLWA